MMRKVREILSCVGNKLKPETPNEEHRRRTGKKRVSFKLDESNDHGGGGGDGDGGENSRNIKRKERPQLELVDAKPDPLEPDPVSELDDWMASVNKSLNLLYVDDFSDDIDMLSLWLDTRAQGRSSAEEERAGTHSAEEHSRAVKDGIKNSLPVPPGLKLLSVERGL